MNLGVGCGSLQLVMECSLVKNHLLELDLNCFISISGVATFKNSTELADAISCIPLENLLVETDSPYLSPEPLRGRSNEPANIVHTIEKLSQIKKVSKESITKHTTKNFLKLFNL